MKLSTLESKIFGKVCYGFRRNRNGIVEIVSHEATIVQKIFALYLDGNSLEEIKDYLQVQQIYFPTGKDTWSRDVLNKLLNNYKYTFGIIDYSTFFEVEELKSDKCHNPNRSLGDVEKWDEQQRQSYYGPMQ